MRATGSCGSVKGSLLVGYAAVFGRLLFGSEASHLAAVTSWSLMMRLTSKTLWSPFAKTAGAPPAPSMSAYPNRFATFEAGTVSSVENGPNARSTWSEEMSFW